MVMLSEGPHPDPGGVARIYREYNMTPENVAQDVAIIRQWIARQPHLPHIPQSKESKCALL